MCISEPSCERGRQRTEMSWRQLAEDGESEPGLGQEGQEPELQETPSATSQGFLGHCCGSHFEVWKQVAAWSRVGEVTSGTFAQQKCSQIWGSDKLAPFSVTEQPSACLGKPIPVCALSGDPFSPLTHISELFQSLCVSCFSQFPTTASSQNIWPQKRSRPCRQGFSTRVIPSQPMPAPGQARFVPKALEPKLPTSVQVTVGAFAHPLLGCRTRDTHR